MFVLGLPKNFKEPTTLLVGLTKFLKFSPAAPNPSIFLLVLIICSIIDLKL